MPVKKTPDGRIIEEKTKTVGFGSADKTKIVGGSAGGAGDRTVLSSSGQQSGGYGDALDDKTQLVGRGQGGRTSSEPKPTEAPGRRSPPGSGRNHLGETKPIGSPSERTGGGALPVEGGSPKTKLVRANAVDAAPQTETDDPVVGWLVIEKGPGMGRSVNLGVGMNTVGRGPNARAQLNFGDESLSGEKHFLVSFDPRSSQFAIHLGDSANLTYLNSSPVYGTQQLSNYDAIEAGNTQLRFVAFCGEHFSWDN